MPPKLPNPNTAFPHRFGEDTVNPNMVHLSQVIDNPNIDIGDYTYANDFDPPAQENWAARLAPYTYPGCPERLVIGKFCQIAHGVRFITASANHRRDALTSYPAEIFDPETGASLIESLGAFPDTVLGNDVWLGHGAMVLPGARLGNGVIVGAGAVVNGTVPDFAVVAGNPARIVRMRFSDDDIARLLDLAWWDWPAEDIEAAWPYLADNNVQSFLRHADARETQSAV